MWKPILLAIVTISAILADNPGDKAKEECKRNGMNMVDCKRIINSSKQRIPADFLEFPHMALVGIKNEANGKIEWKCGGSLISPLWVLTSARCITDPKKQKPSVVKLGTVSFEVEVDEDVSQDRKIVEVVPHPDYDMIRAYNDIGLLKLDKPVDIGHVRIICLKIENTTDHKTFTVSGFGSTSFNSTTPSKTLKFLDVGFINPTNCDQYTKAYKNKGVLDKGIEDSSQICAGDLAHGGNDVCHGDYGSPLQVYPEDVDCVSKFPLFTLYGVNSLDESCGSAQTPASVYTRVSYYVPWIEKHVWSSNTHQGHV